MSRADSCWILLGLCLGLGACRETPKPESLLVERDPSVEPAQRDDPAAAETPPQLRDFLMEGSAYVPDPVRNPFAPSPAWEKVAASGTGAKKGAKDALTLLGIIHRDGQRVAVTTRGSGQVGEEVDGWIIANIEEDGITLRQGSQRLRLSLEP